MVIDTGLLLDVKDFEFGLVAAIGGEFGLISSKAVANFSEPKSSSDVDTWGELSWFPPPSGRIAPVESDGLWSALDGPLVLGAEPGGVAFRAIVFRRRNSHRATTAIRTRTATPPTTPPAIIPFFVCEIPETSAGDVTDWPLVEDVLEDWERIEVGLTKGVEVGSVDGVEDSETEDCDETTHETSAPLMTAKTLDNTTWVDV